MDAEEAKALLKERGISVMNVPHGYMVTISKREGSPSRRIDMDEMDAILALGMIRLLAVEDTVGDILIVSETDEMNQTSHHAMSLLCLHRH
jgi:hypothetical protein